MHLIMFIKISISQIISFVDLLLRFIQFILPRHRYIDPSVLLINIRSISSMNRSLNICIFFAFFLQINIITIPPTGAVTPIVDLNIADSCNLQALVNIIKIVLILKNEEVHIVDFIASLGGRCFGFSII